MLRGDGEVLGRLVHYKLWKGREKGYRQNMRAWVSGTAVYIEDLSNPEIALYVKQLASFSEAYAFFDSLPGEAVVLEQREASQALVKQRSVDLPEELLNRWGRGVQPSCSHQQSRNRCASATLSAPLCRGRARLYPATESLGEASDGAAARSVI